MGKLLTVCANKRLEAKALNGRCSFLCADEGEPLILLGKVSNTDQYLVSVQDRNRPLMFKARKHELLF